MGRGKGRLVAVGILDTGEHIEVISQRDWSRRGSRQEATESNSDKALRFRARKDARKADRAEARALRAEYGGVVR